MSIEIWSNSSSKIPPVTIRRTVSDSRLVQILSDMIRQEPEDADIFAERDDNASTRIVLVKLNGVVLREIPIQPSAGVYEFVPV